MLQNFKLDIIEQFDDERKALDQNCIGFDFGLIGTYYSDGKRNYVGVPFKEEDKDKTINELMAIAEETIIKRGG